MTNYATVLKIRFRASNHFLSDFFFLVNAWCVRCGEASTSAEFGVADVVKTAFAMVFAVISPGAIGTSKGKLIYK